MKREKNGEVGEELCFCLFNLEQTVSVTVDSLIISEETESENSKFLVPDLLSLPPPKQNK